jgi:Histidine phosphatase superfamily (branch 2)
LPVLVTCQTRRLQLLNVNMIVLAGYTAPRDNIVKRPSEQIIGNVSYNSLLDSGKRQMYILGKRYRKEFSTFLASIKGTSNSISIRALNNMPGVMSAWALSLGMLPDNQKLDTPYPTEKAKPRFAGKAPSPVNFTSPLPASEPLKRISFSDFEQTDYLFQLSSLYTCPNFNINIVKKEIKRLSKKFTFDESFNKVSEYMQYDPENIDFMKSTSKLYRSSRLFEFLEAMNSVGLNTKFPTNSKEYKDLQVAHEAYMTSITANSDTLNLLNSPIASLILQNIEHTRGISEKSQDEGKKMNIYMGHQKFMIGILNFLGLYKPECAYKPYTDGTESPSTCVEFPRPGASILIEFYKEDFGTDIKPAFSNYYVNIQYNGRSVGLGQKSMNNNDEDGLIEYDEFVRFLNAKIIRNWEGACGLGEIEKADSQERSSITWVILLVVFNIIVFISLGCTMICFKLMSKASMIEDKPENDRCSTDLKIKLSENN